MPVGPVVDPAVRWREMEKGGVFLEWFGRSAVLRHPVYALLLSRLDGRGPPDEVVASLPETVTPAEAFFALDRLRAMGVVTDDPPAAVPFLPSRAGGPAGCARVRCRGLDEPDHGALDTMLARAGIETAEDATVALWVVSDLLDPVVEEWNRLALAGNEIWMCLVALGGEAWLGPVHRPGAPCTECLRYLVGRHTVGRGAGVGPLQTMGPRVGPATAAALEAVRDRLGGADPGRREGRDLMRFLPDGSRTRHGVVPWPQCPGCGPTRVPRPRTKRAREPVDKGRPGSSVRDRILAQVDGVTGVVRSVTLLSHLEGSPWSVHRAVGPYPPGPGVGPPVTGLGCGFDPDASRLRAAAEVVERYAGTFQGDEPRVRASYRELGAEAIHPNQCMAFSERQYRTRETWNAHATPFAAVPEPFDPGASVEWTPVRSMLGAGTRLLPTSYLYFAVPAECGDPGVLPDSNGCAAGDTPEEAQLRGLLELIERDAVAAWWYSRAPAPALPDAWAESGPWAPALAHLATLGRRTWALDLTTDLEIPVAAVVSGEGARGGERILFGFGAGLGMEAAVAGALREMLQMLTVVGQGSHALHRLAPDLRIWLQNQTVALNPWLRGSEPRGPWDPGAEATTPSEGLGRCLGSLASRGLEAFVLDQTRPDLAIPVVRVVAPGLRHFWPRFAPGRLYDVPVAVGWLPRARREEELNPTPLFV